MTTRVETKPGPWNIDDPSWPVYVPVPPNAVITSDTFTGPDGPLGGTSTDALWGGSPAVWTATVNATREGGKFKAVGEAAGFLPCSDADVEVSVVVEAFPTSGVAAVAVLRAEGTSVGIWNTSYRLEVTSSGSVRIAYRGGGSNTTLVSAGSIVEGDKVTFRAVGTTLTVFVNDVFLESVEHAAIVGGSYAGMSFATGGCVLDNFVVRRIDRPDLL